MLCKLVSALGTLPSQHPQRDTFLSEVDNSISAEFWEFSQASPGIIEDGVKGYSDSTWGRKVVNLFLVRHKLLPSY